MAVYGGADIPFLQSLPLASLGFGWLLPAAVCGLIGAFIPGQLPDQPLSSHP